MDMVLARTFLVSASVRRTFMVFSEDFGRLLDSFVRAKKKGKEVAQLSLADVVHF